MMSGVATFRQQGSLTALSLLAANPEAQLIGAAVIGSVAVTVAGAKFAYKEFKEYEEKKHLDEINYINQLHDKYLAKISVPGKNQTLSLPAIFKMKSDKELKSVESLYYNDDIVKSIADFLPAGTDVALSKYQVSIRNAILKLQSYYFSRGDHHDTTSSVILYLIQMLDSHCLKFEGYDFDIAYLGAIASFINEFASTDRRVNTKKFSHLDEVYSHIVNAQHMLDLHKDKLSLTEIIHDLFHSIRNLNDQYIRSFSMLSNPKSTWRLIETVTLEELSNGMLKKYYVANDLLLGLITIPDNEVDIFKTPFKAALMQLAAYAEKANDPDASLSPSDIPTINITIPDLKRYNELKNKKLQSKDKSTKEQKIEKEKLTKEEKAEKDIIKNQLEDLKKAFYNCENFITTQLDHKTKSSKNKFVAVIEYDELVKRTEMINRYANLIREIISLQYYSMNLIKGIRLLGEIDVSNSYHKKVFKVMDELCAKIKSDYSKVKNDFYQIQKENNAMKLVEQTNHRDKIYSLLESTSTIIGNAKTAINNYWYKNRKISHQRKINAEHNLFHAADLIGKVHALPFLLGVEQKKKSKRKISPKNKSKISLQKLPQEKSFPQNDTTHGVPDTSAEVDVKDIIVSIQPEILVKPEQSDTHAKALENGSNKIILPYSKKEDKDDDKDDHTNEDDSKRLDNSSNPDHSQNQGTKSASDNEKSDIKIIDDDAIIKKIKEKLTTIQNAINIIRKEENPSIDDIEGSKAFGIEMTAYNELYQNIIMVFHKIAAMFKEQNKSQQRNVKLDHMLTLFSTITDKFHEFILLKRKQRLLNVDCFNQSIHKIISDQGHSTFIDDHDDNFWKFANSIFGAGYFRTDGRIKLSNISNASNNLMNILVEGKKQSIFRII